MGCQLAESCLKFSIFRAAAQSADCCTECSIFPATATSGGGVLHGMQYFSCYGHYRRGIVARNAAFLVLLPLQTPVCCITCSISLAFVFQKSDCCKTYSISPPSHSVHKKTPAQVNPSPVQVSFDILHNILVISPGNFPGLVSLTFNILVDQHIQLHRLAEHFRVADPQLQGQGVQLFPGLFNTCLMLFISHNGRFSRQRIVPAAQACGLPSRTSPQPSYRS